MNNTIKNSSGFTLVEMLVVIGIFGVILGGVLKVFDTSNYIYTVQEGIADMQQNVRVSKMFLEQDVRMAGCALSNFYIYESEVFPVTFQNGVGTNGSDKLFINYIDYSVSTCDGVLPDLTTNGEMPENSAEAEINEELSNSPYDAWTEEFTCDGNTYGGTPFVKFMAIIKAPDGSKSDVVWVTQVQNTGGTDKIQNNNYPNGCPGGCNKIINSYPENSILTFFNTNQLKRVAYYVSDNKLIRDTLDPIDGATVTASDTIAVNIEDLQFAFGLDTDADDFIDTWIGDSGGSDVLTDAQSSEVRLIRISVTGRTAAEHRGCSNTRPAVENNTAGATSDGFRRKLLQVTVKVRNLGLT